MVGREINLHRRLRRGRISQRYRRLCNEIDLPARMTADDRRDPCADDPDDRYADRHDGYDDYDDYDRYDPQHDHRLRLDRALTQLRFAIQASVPFNPVLAPRVGLRHRPSSSVRAPVAELERRLVEHLLHVDEGNVEQMFAPGELECLAALDDSAAELAATLALLRPFWLRDIAAWPSGSPTELIEHLLVAYPYPRFLLNAWREAFSPCHLAWMLVACQGGSLRRLAQIAIELECPGTWFELPKRLPGLLFEVPPNLAPLDGLIYAHVLLRGGANVEFARLRWSCPLHWTTFEQDRFDHWLDTVQWFARHREEIRDSECRRWIGWADHMWVELQRVNQLFRWTGRTPASVRRTVDEWYAALERLQQMRSRAYSLSWPSLELDATFELADVTWTFTELCSGAALLAETQRMNHCVYSYAIACWQRRCAIVSLTRAGLACLTIELRLPTLTAVQIRGRYNRMPTAEEYVVVERWLAGFRQRAVA
jgi:hypothetical protein